MSLSKPRFQNTPEYCDKTVLSYRHEIFVFGSNTQGIHRSGSAKTALEDFGAVYGVPMGLQKRSYAIVTKDFPHFDPQNEAYMTTMSELIQVQIIGLYKFANLRSELHFYVTKIGTNLGGFTIESISALFRSIPDKPFNVILPAEFE